MENLNGFNSIRGIIFSGLTIVLFAFSFSYIPISVVSVSISILCFGVPAGFSIYLLNKGSNDRYILPGLWTSSGILGTFITLVLSVAALKANEKGVLSIGIPFIKSFISAFTTSIVGITGSIAMRFFITDQEKMEDEAEVDAMEEYEKKSEKYYLYQIVQRMEAMETEYKENISSKLAGILEEQQTTTTGITKLINIFSNIEIALGGFVSVLETELSKAMTNLTTTTGEKIAEEMKTLTGALEKMLEGANTLFTEAHNDLLKANNAQLEEKLQESTDALTTMQDQLKTDFEDTAKNVQESLAGIVTSLNTEFETAANNISSKFSTAIDDHEARMKTLHEEYTKLAGDHVEGLETSFTTMEAVVNDLSEEFKEYRQQLRLTRAFGKKTMDGWSKNVARFDELIKLFEKVYAPTKELGEQIKQWSENIEQVNIKHSDYEEEVEKVGLLMKKMSDVVNGLGDIEDKLNRI